MSATPGRKATPLEEVYKSLELCNYSTRGVGLSFIDAPPTSLIVRIRMTAQFWVSALALLALIATETAYIYDLVAQASSLTDFVSCLHILGYGSMSAHKLLTLWYKRHTFRKLLIDLADIWPASGEDQVVDNIKEESIKALRMGHVCYALFNVLGLVMYNITPVGLHFYRMSRGQPSDLGFVWWSLYPFDKTKSIYHEFVYAFECFAATASTFGMLGSDMFFTAMATHISMLLRLLQMKIRKLAAGSSDTLVDCYPEIVQIVKTHQRFISFTSDLEDTFSFVNLINVLLSSVNICCVVFNIVGPVAGQGSTGADVPTWELEALVALFAQLLDPWMAMSNKFFLGAALTQVGILCWCADDISRASVEVADAVYESNWCAADARARRGLLILMQRSQRPLYFTAFKFGPITIQTFRSIITNSYSYFTLLYTVYTDD